MSAQETTPGQASDACPACGWRVHSAFDLHPCDPALGRAAQALQTAVSDVSSTKLGYGRHRLTFEIGDDLCVGLDVVHPWGADGERRADAVEYHWQYLHALAHLSQDDAADLVRSLRDWDQCRRDRASIRLVMADEIRDPKEVQI